MASKLLPSHALPRLTAAATATTRVALCARQARLALPAFSSPSPLYSHFLSCAAAAASPAVAGRRRGGALVVARAAEGNEPAETPEDDAAANDEEAGVSEEEEEKELEPPRKPIVKLGDIMGILHKRAIEASDKGRPVPDLRTGDVVQIKLSVPRKRRKVSFYKGIVMSKQSAGIDTTIRIRRIISGIGVEIVFPVYSPSVLDIKVIGRKKVRRAKLYYLRDKLPRLSTVK